MRILTKEELAKNLGYCAYYAGAGMLIPDGTGKLRVPSDFAARYKSQILIFDENDRFIDNNGNVNKEMMVEKETGRIYCWLGGIIVYKDKEDQSSIDIIEARARAWVYCIIKDSDIDSIMGGKEMLNHHNLLTHDSHGLTFPGDDLKEFHSDLMVITDGNLRCGRILESLTSRHEEFFSEVVPGEAGSVVKCHYALNGNYIVIPMNMYDDSNEFDISKKISSNIIDVDDMTNIINSKRAEVEEDFTDEILTGIIYLCLSKIEAHLQNDEELVKDLFMYWKKYVEEVPVDSVRLVGGAESFKDRAAKLLGL